MLKKKARKRRLSKAAMISDIKARLGRVERFVDAQEGVYTKYISWKRRGGPHGRI